jgi:hypothetical protein
MTEHGIYATAVRSHPLRRYHPLIIDTVEVAVKEIIVSLRILVFHSLFLSGIEFVKLSGFLVSVALLAAGLTAQTNQPDFIPSTYDRSSAFLHRHPP